MINTKWLKLPFSFDITRLQADLQVIKESEWIPHMNTAVYKKKWDCVPLKSVNGSLRNIVCEPDAKFKETEILKRCPYFQEVLKTFQCELTSVRLMSLEAGGVIGEHTDSGSSFDDGMVRIHIPIKTTPKALFSIDGNEVHFPAGQTWYFDANCKHGVTNKAATPRVHILLDMIPNDWLEDVFLKAGFQHNDKPKYGDPSINDENIDMIIAQFESLGTEHSKALAENLRRKKDTISYS